MNNQHLTFRKDHYTVMIDPVFFQIDAIWNYLSQSHRVPRIDEETVYLSIKK